jgi:threonine/homoserine/homoserine lactone efflux protein
MGPTSAVLAGLTVGLAIAMQVGPVSLLVVEASVVRGLRAAAAAGLGVATADLAFATVAAATGGAAGAALAGHEGQIRIGAALALAAIAVSGLIGVLRSGAPDAEEAESPGVAGGGSARAHYARFLAITIANPLTIASFAAAATALSVDSPVSATAFAAGVGVASAAWHLALSGAAGFAGRWVTCRVRRALAIGGRLGVLALAAHLALAA